jgi:hypothetical protein
MKTYWVKLTKPAYTLEVYIIADQVEFFRWLDMACYMGFCIDWHVFPTRVGMER